ncbi:hypothetical protein DFP72DRAFT_73874 [Ephemerocybe angulata]|uniref:Uncharacterized protein n=1 Tax=Ephemerocybe angulata TaxID=980116 RepID=A0A8H6I7S9_9AGAR|nr:hypothetical protein DFP72DRAFT_73874 [Tulosesus angulatus]
MALTLCESLPIDLTDRISQEIIDNILPLFNPKTRVDIHALKSARLVCCAWEISARRTLFSTFLFTVAKIRSLANGPEAGRRLLPSIRCASFKCPDQELSSTEERNEMENKLLKIVPKMSQLHALNFYQCTLGFVALVGGIVRRDEIKGLSVGNSFWDAACQLPEAVSLFPHLQTLELRGIGFPDEASHIGSTVEFPFPKGLSSIDISSYEWMFVIIPWISRFAAQIRSVTLHVVGSYQAIFIGHFPQAEHLTLHFYPPFYLESLVAEVTLAGCKSLKSLVIASRLSNRNDSPRVFQWYSQLISSVTSPGLSHLTFTLQFCRESDLDYVEWQALNTLLLGSRFFMELKEIAVRVELLQQPWVPLEEIQATLRRKVDPRSRICLEVEYVGIRKAIEV